MWTVCAQPERSMSSLLYSPDSSPYVLVHMVGPLVATLLTVVGEANGGSEIVKMWKDYFKGILNSANGSAESVEHSIDFKENYLGLEMPMCSFVSLASLLQKLALKKLQGLIVFLQSTFCMQMKQKFFSQWTVYCSQVYTQFLFKHNNSSHMQKQEWEYVWHFKLQTSRSSHSGVKAAWELHII